MVLPKNFALMADMDILLIDLDNYTSSFVLGAGYNFNFGIERLKLIASGVMGFEFGNGNKDGGSVYYDGKNRSCEIDYEKGNFIFGVDLYANFRLGKKFGLFAQCDILFGVGSCEGDVEAVVEEAHGIYKAETETVASGSGSSQTFMFKPKFGLCWTF